MKLVFENSRLIQDKKTVASYRWGFGAGYIHGHEGKRGRVQLKLVQI